VRKKAVEKNAVCASYTRQDNKIPRDKCVVVGRPTSGKNRRSREKEARERNEHKEKPAGGEGRHTAPTPNEKACTNERTNVLSRQATGKRRMDKKGGSKITKWGTGTKRRKVAALKTKPVTKNQRNLPEKPLGVPPRDEKKRGGQHPPQRTGLENPKRPKGKKRRDTPWREKRASKLVQ